MSNDINPYNGQDALTTMIIKDIIKGYTLEQIAARHECELPDVVKRWQKYVSNRTEMSKPEQWVLHLLRLEDLLQRVNTKLEYSDTIEDFGQVVQILDRIEALQSTNLSRKQEAEAELVTLSRAQGELLAQAFAHFGILMKQHIDQALTKPTIKAIKGEFAEYDEVVVELTEKALEVIEEKNNETD